MKFPRNAKIFRGQLDAAPLAGVFFLFLIFILLAALVYTPGIPFALDETLASANTSKRTVTIRNSEIVFDGRTNKIEELDLLRAQFKKLPPQSVLVVKSELPLSADLSAVMRSRQLVLLVRDQARDLPITLEMPGVSIELPDAGNETLSGTANRTIVVAVNLGGQLFFENQLIDEAKLKTKLEEAVARTGEPLTLIVMADKSSQNGIIVRLGDLARQIGIKEMLVAARPKS